MLISHSRRVLPSVLDQLNSGMFLNKLSVKLNLASPGTSHWNSISFYTLGLILGAITLTSTLLVGSFLWGYISKKHKNGSEKSLPVQDCYPLAAYQGPGAAGDFPGIFRRTDSSNLNVPNARSTQIDSPIFDPEINYAKEMLPIGNISSIAGASNVEKFKEFKEF